MPNANELVRAIADSEVRALFEDAVMRMAEKAALQDEAHRRRSMKGALVTSMAAEQRKQEAARVARELIDKRGRPFSSYRQLARAVAGHRDIYMPFETLRKYLAEFRMLEI